MLSGMKTEMYATNIDAAWRGDVGDDDFDLEQEWETWNWVRAAGVSAQDLRSALRESIDLAEVN